MFVLLFFFGSINPLDACVKTVRLTGRREAIQPSVPPTETHFPSPRGPPVDTEIRLIERAALHGAVIEVFMRKARDDFRRAPTPLGHDAAGVSDRAVVRPRLASENCIPRAPRPNSCLTAA